MRLVAALAAAYGVHLLYTSLLFGWRGIGPGPSDREGAAGSRRRPLDDLDVHARELALLLVVVAAGAGAVGWVLFGGIVAPLMAAVGGAVAALTGLRSRVERRRARAAEVWPHLIDAIRVETVTLGRSVPQALFAAGERAPAEMQRAFASARRSWSVSADLEQALDVLRAGLAHPTADAVCETLLVANQVGGPDVDRCLRALADDRHADLEARRDAEAEQAGARFARSFTLVVPLGMAGVGAGIGEGRAAYTSSTGQLLVGVGVAVMVACWLWAGRVMRLPAERRVFVGSAR